MECVVEPADVRDTSLPLKVEIVAKLPEMTLKGESRVELSVPFATRVLGLVGMMVRDNTALEKRKYPLVLDCTAGVFEDVELDLGQCRRLGTPALSGLCQNDANLLGGTNVTHKY